MDPNKFAAAFLALGVIAPSTGFTTVATARAAPTVQIVKVSYDSPGTDRGTNASLNAEWVQIKNTSKKTRHLKGWSLRGESGATYYFPATTLKPGKSVTVHSGAGRNRPGHRYWGRGSHVWHNGGDTTTLRNAAGKRVDSCKLSGKRDSANC